MAAHRPQPAEDTTTPYATVAGKLIAIEVDARELGRSVELIPDEAHRVLADRAFLLASAIREIRAEITR